MKTAVILTTLILGLGAVGCGKGEVSKNKLYSDSQYNPYDPEWLNIAKLEIGVKEVRGSKSNPTILNYFKSVGSGWIKKDSMAWCGAFVGWALTEAGVDVPRPVMGGFRAVSAKTWQKFGYEMDSSEVVPGAIVILRDTNDTSEDTDSGYHVAFYLRTEVKDGNTSIVLLGGNQSDSVKVKSYPMSSWEVVSYQWPWGEPY